MNFIKQSIKKKENEVITRSNNSLQLLGESWNAFVNKNIYLIYDEKSNFLQQVDNGSAKSRPPWYLFWNLKLKSFLKTNAEKFSDIKSNIEIYNQSFIIQKKNEYKNLFIRGNLTLDDDQQTAVVTDDKYNLVIAGAGSGKTEVLITRIAYLIKRKTDSIKPDRILALAFQNKAAYEMKDRLKKRYRTDVEIRTFHSLGRKIINDGAKNKGTKPPALKAETSDDWKYRKYIQSIFDKEVSNNRNLQNDVITFMKRYGDDEIIKDETDFEKKEKYYEHQRNIKYTALDGTKVKSEAEREILNFFLMHKLNGNKIRIIYEHPANWMKYKNEYGEVVIPKPDFYFQDFNIYLEHWAVNSKGKVPDWFGGENPTKKYTHSMNLKKNKFKEHKRMLIETSHADYEKGELIEKLTERFIAALKIKAPHKKFEFQSLSYQELMESVWESSKFVKQVPGNISRYIVIAKTYRLYPEDIEARLKGEKWSPKQYSFAKIANQIYAIYQSELQKGNFIDFSDMINTAVDYLSENEELYKDKYDHILIDEYQDISCQRYEMIKELMKKNSKCKLFCVGDDWQSIMGFAGSNLDYFINFKKYFPHPAITNLTMNYRSIKSIVDTGAAIIKNNKGGQIKKKTISNINESKPILVFSSRHRKKDFNKYYEQIARHCLDAIKEYRETKNYSYDDFMILMRIANNPGLLNFISNYANQLKIPVSQNVDRPHCVHIMSVHRSKGLQARVVIILNVYKDLYGFPCEIEDADIYSPAIKNNDGLRKEEERRLFYVAVTRAKEEVIIYTQSGYESEFITEIKASIKKEEL